MQPQHREWNDADYGNHAGAVVVSQGELDVIDCQCCGFRHVVPLPSAEVLKAFYEQEFYQSEKPDYLNRNQEDNDWRTLEFGDRYDEVEAVLVPDGQRRVLDIGCGPGDFLATGQGRGWQTMGVEPSPVASEFARSRGIDILTAPFDAKVASGLGQFEFIHMNKVLEHVPDPHGLVATAAGLLAPGGVLCVSVPNDFNPFQRAFRAEVGAKPWWVVPDHHLNYFNFDSLGGLLEKQGLSIFARSTDFPMELFLLMGQDYTADPALGRELHMRRKRVDMILADHEPVARRAFYQSLAAAGLGRMAIIYAQKG